MKHIRLTEGNLNKIVTNAVKRALNESIDASSIFLQVKRNLWELLESGEMEVIFGNFVGQTFNVYTVSETEIEVEYNGKSMKMECGNLEDEERLARCIMYCFAKLYLG